MSRIHAIVTYICVQRTCPTSLLCSWSTGIVLCLQIQTEQPDRCLICCSPRATQRLPHIHCHHSIPAAPAPLPYPSVHGLALLPIAASQYLSCTSANALPSHPFLSACLNCISAAALPTQPPVFAYLSRTSAALSSRSRREWYTGNGCLSSVAMGVERSPLPNSRLTHVPALLPLPALLPMLDPAASPPSTSRASSAPDTCPLALA